MVQGFAFGLLRKIKLVRMGKRIAQLNQSEVSLALFLLDLV